MKILGGALLAALVSVLAHRWLPAPFLWVSAALVLFCGHAARATTRGGVRLLWIYLAAAIAALGLAEGHLWLGSGGAGPELRMEGPRVHERDPVLGWVLPADATWPAAKYLGDEPIYDVTYSTDSRGLRVAPESDAGPCVLFFGGSVTFGEGVEDWQAMPFRVGEQSGWRILNFGVGGYGPHQMLAALESGRLAEVVDCEPRYVIFQGLNDHVARAAGKRSWAREGPRYRLATDGSVRRAGRFDDVPPRARPLEASLGRSLLWQRLFAGEPAVAEADVELYVAILAAARRRVAELYPAASFQVLQWGTKYRDALAPLAEAGIPLHFVDDILPGYAEDPVRYQLHALDLHPNPAGHERIAEYVTRQILRR